MKVSLIMNSNKKYIVVIDTDSYAGNFERDMTAYITGVVGDCGDGSEFVELYDKETGDANHEKFNDIIDHRPDDNGCYRPCSIWETKGYLFDGANGSVKEEDFNQEEANKKYRESNAKIYDGYIKNVEKIIPSSTNKWTLKSKKKEINRLKKERERCLKEICPRCAPYNSVAIFFEELPNKNILKLIKTRALQFPQVHKEREERLYNIRKMKSIEILKFRLIEEVTNQSEKELNI